MTPISEHGEITTIYAILRAVMPQECKSVETFADYVISDNKAEITLEQLLGVMPTIEYKAGWVTGDVVNVYLTMLAKQNQNIIPIHTLTATQIAHRQPTTRSFDSILCHQSQKPTFRSHAHLWPIHVNDNHWILIVVDWKGKIFTVYDSMNESHKYSMQANNIRDFYARYCAREFDPMDAEILLNNKAVENNAGRHCGIYILMRAVMISSGIKRLAYVDFRTRLTFELVTHSILPSGEHPTREDANRLFAGFRKIAQFILSSEPDSQIASIEDCEKHIALARTVEQASTSELGNVAREMKTFATRVINLIKNKKERTLFLFNKSSNKWLNKTEILTPSSASPSPKTLPPLSIEIPSDHPIAPMTPPSEPLIATTDATRETSTPVPSIPSAILTPTPSTPRKNASSIDPQSFATLTPKKRSRAVLEWNSSQTEMSVDQPQTVDRRVIHNRVTESKEISNDVAERFFEGWETQLFPKERKDANFLRLLAREKRKIAQGKRLSYKYMTPEAKDQREKKLEEAFRRLKELGLVEKGAQYDYNSVSLFKQHLAIDSYEDGMSGEERPEPTYGPPFLADDKLQCRLCGAVRKGLYHAIDHIVKYSVPEYFQKADVFGRKHPRVDLSTVLNNPRMISVLYLQRAPPVRPPDRYDTRDWIIDEKDPSIITPAPRTNVRDSSLVSPPSPTSKEKSERQPIISSDEDEKKSDNPRGGGSSENSPNNTPRRRSQRKKTRPRYKLSKTYKKRQESLPEESTNGESNDGGE